MIAIVVAIANNNVIGKRNALPWYLPDDLKRFKKLTTGHTVLMGRKTYESIVKRLGKPLPNRKSAVVTRNKDYKVPEGVLLFETLDGAFAALKDDEVYIIGGGEIYRQTFDRADTLYITHINADYDGDVFFPEIDLAVWQKVEDEPHDGFSFATYRRISPPREEG